MRYSLMAFAVTSDEVEPYGLLLDVADIADEGPFTAIWTPERHFNRFGGSFPNPAITTAALAARTSRIELRAGSLVVGLHNPIRVVEDWSMLDALSGGRVAISFAAGWNPDDYGLAPDAFSQRHAELW